MFKYVKNEEGATSVLIIFMMIVLVTLGAFAITSANVNIKFSRKSINWTNMYYQLDTKGEIFVRDIDLALTLAEDKAIDYVNASGFLMTATEATLPGDLQESNREIWLLATSKSEALKEIFQATYFYFAREQINELQFDYQEAQILPFEVGNLVKGLKMETDFTATEDENFHLRVALEVMPIADSYNFSINSQGVVTEQKSDFLRYDIHDWHQWQTPKEYESGLELWDGSF